MKKKVIIIAVAVLLLAAITVTVILLSGKKEGTLTDENTLASDYGYKVKELENGSAEVTLAKNEFAEAKWSVTLNDEGIVETDISYGEKEDVITFKPIADGSAIGKFYLTNGNKDLYCINWYLGVAEMKVGITVTSCAHIYSDLLFDNGNGITVSCSSKDTQYLLVKISGAENDMWQFDTPDEVLINTHDFDNGKAVFDITASTVGEYTVIFKNFDNKYAVKIQIKVDNTYSVEAVHGEFTEYSTESFNKSNEEQTTVTVEEDPFDKLNDETQNVFKYYGISLSSEFTDVQCAVDKYQREYDEKEGVEADSYPLKYSVSFTYKLHTYLLVGDAEVEKFDITERYENIEIVDNVYYAVEGDSACFFKRGHFVTVTATDGGTDMVEILSVIF